MVKIKKTTTNKVTKQTNQIRPKNKTNFNWQKFLKLSFEIILLSVWVVGVVIGSQYLVAWPMRLILPLNVLNSPLTIVIYSFVSYAIALLIIIFVTPLFKLEINTKTKTYRFKTPDIVKSNRTELGLRGLPTWTDIGLAPVGYIISLLIAAVLTALFSLFPWFNANEAQTTGFSIFMSTPERIVAFFSLVVLAPIAEELIFRGWLYGKLRRLISAPLAILITSLLFAIVHGQWNVGVTVFALSIVLCIQREITGTIYSGILLHMLKNAIAFYLLYVVGFT